jgi:hypothetical protein
MMKDEREVTPKDCSFRLPPSSINLLPFPFLLRRRLWPAELL